MMTAIPLRPVNSLANVEQSLKDRLAEMQRRAQGRDAKGILHMALVEEFPRKKAIVSSFSAESVVLLHLVAQIDPATAVLFLNTGKL